MKNWILSAEAEECRLLAAEMANQPERTFLLCLASAFDDLHVLRPTSPIAPQGCKPFSVFRTAREEAATKAAHDNWDNEGGHMSSTSGLVVSTPAAELPYKVVLRHEGLPDTEHAFRTIHECETFIGVTLPAHSPATTTVTQGRAPYGDKHPHIANRGPVTRSEP